jgi:hypothetical protein
MSSPTIIEIVLYPSHRPLTPTWRHMKPENTNFFASLPRASRARLLLRVIPRALTFQIFSYSKAINIPIDAGKHCLYVLNWWRYIRHLRPYFMQKHCPCHLKHSDSSCTVILLYIVEICRALATLVQWIRETGFGHFFIRRAKCNKFGQILFCFPPPPPPPLIFSIPYAYVCNKQLFDYNFISIACEKIACSQVSEKHASSFTQSNTQYFLRIFSPQYFLRFLL